MAITVYTKQECSFCVKAINLLTYDKEQTITVIDVTKDEQTHNIIKEQTSHETVPAIFIGGKFLGGCSELFELEEKGKLDILLLKEDIRELKREMKYLKQERRV